MPAQVNQDFVTYQGNSYSPVFTVFGNPSTLTGLSTAVDVSTTTGNVVDIQWSARRNLTDPVVVTKLKSSSGIVYTGNNGTDGKFIVNLSSTDLASLSGWYIHTATIIQGSGSTAITTVAVGRMNVGQAPDWTYDDATAATESLYLVRALIGDTIQSDQLLSDQAIIISINRYTVVELAAAECCRFIAARFAREIDLVNGQLKTNYSQKSKAYLAMNRELLQIGYARGGAQAYTGGTNLTDKDNNVSNTDRVPPQFNIGMFDNLLPESPVGHQVGAGQANEQTFISDIGQM